MKSEWSRNILFEKISEVNIARGKIVVHLDHFHRSLVELHYCKEFMRLYDNARLFANVHLAGRELDWVIGNNREDPKTWELVIEYHQVRYWDVKGYGSLGETKEGYITTRIKELRERGVFCPIRIITMSRGRKLEVTEIPATSVGANPYMS
jgi:hypothetical protein